MGMGVASRMPVMDARLQWARSRNVAAVVNGLGPHTSNVWAARPRASLQSSRIVTRAARRAST